jgi:hypothetical protein
MNKVGQALPNQLRSLAEEGVQTYQELRDSFAEAARSALNAARDELNESEGFTGIGNYLRKQFQARSVTPKTGDDADAVLSRAEQALRENDLNGALNELDALPDAARRSDATLDRSSARTSRRAGTIRHFKPRNRKLSHADITV